MCAIGDACTAALQADHRALDISALPRSMSVREGSHHLFFNLWTIGQQVPEALLELLPSLHHLRQRAAEEAAAAFDCLQADGDGGGEDGDDADDHPCDREEGGEDQEVGKVADLDCAGAFDGLADVRLDLVPVGG